MNPMYSAAAWAGRTVGTLEWFWRYKSDVLIAYLSFVLAGVVHELGHGIANGLTGGDFGFACPACNGGDRIIGGYGINSVFLGIMPVFSIYYGESGHRLIALVMGPLSVVLIAWYLGTRWNLTKLRREYAPRSWGKILRRSIMLGFLVRAWFDSIYLFPIDPFPDQNVHGDGTEIYGWFKDTGYHSYDALNAFGVEVPVMFNPAYVIAAVAVLGTVWVTYRVFSCTNFFCNSCQVRR